MTCFENRLAAGHIATLASGEPDRAFLDQGLPTTFSPVSGAQGVGLYRPDGTVLKLIAPIRREPISRST
jgi:hypothetical protein